MTAVPDADTAHEAIECQFFDIVFLDVMLPGGLEVLRRLREEDPEVKVVITIDNNYHHQLVDEAFKLGPVVALSKPLWPRDISGAIRLLQAPWLCWSGSSVQQGKRWASAQHGLLHREAVG